MPNKSAPLPKPPRTKELYAGYRESELRSSYFYAKYETLDDPEASVAMAKAGDDETDKVAEFHTAIVKSRPHDLEDVHAKLLVLMDDLKPVFERSSDGMTDQRKLLESVIEWVHSHAVFEAPSKQRPDNPMATEESAE